MTACPVCKSSDVRVGWPEGSLVMPVNGKRVRSAERNGVLVPLTCKKCGHQWTIRYLPPNTEGERMDAEARA